MPNMPAPAVSTARQAPPRCFGSLNVTGRIARVRHRRRPDHPHLGRTQPRQTPALDHALTRIPGPSDPLPAADACRQQHPWHRARHAGDPRHWQPGRPDHPVAAITRQRKTPARATSVTLLGPLLRLLASTGLLRWFVNRQRLVHNFATNLRGPAQPLTFAGAPLRAVIPIPSTIGNVPVTFAALSHAGTLRLTCCPTRPRYRTWKC
jgi:hypothetical protein